MLMVLNALVLGIGVVATVDLRRLQTPGGTALRWVQAAVFGECDDYLTFSVAAGDVPDGRSRAALCDDLRTATARARVEQLQIGLRVGAVEEHGQRAAVAVVLTRHGVPVTLHLTLVRRDGHWRVLRDAATCQSVGCA